MIIKYNSNEYKIYFKHIRKTYYQNKLDDWQQKDFVPNDLTICYIENKFTREIISQSIYKFPTNENFVKEVGRQISLTMAIQNIDDGLRELIFNEYNGFKSKP